MLCPRSELNAEEKVIKSRLSARFDSFIKIYCGTGLALDEVEGCIPAPEAMVTTTGHCACVCVCVRVLQRLKTQRPVKLRSHGTQ